MVVFPIEFSKYRTIVGIHIVANSPNLVCERQGYTNDLKSTLLDLYNVNDGGKHSWPINWISVGF